MASEPVIHITLTAVGSQRRLSLHAPGAPLVLIFHGREHSEISRQVNDALRRRYYAASELIVATVVDLSIAPRLLRRVIEPFLTAAYQDAARQLKPDMPPEDYLLILPDWDGRVGRALRIVDPNRVPGVAVLDRFGGLVGRRQGGDLPAYAIRLAEQAMRVG
jgi:hypothetical protein